MSGQTIDYDALAKQAGAVSSAPSSSGPGIDYDRLARQSGAVSSTPVSSTPAPGFLDKQIPLNSYANATLSGVQSIGQGVRSAVQGAAAQFAPPETAGEKVAAMMPGILPAYRIARGFIQSAGQATQVPSAIHDINQSADPLGTYANVAQQTAGQGAGQALTALATEGMARSAQVIRGMPDPGIQPTAAPKTPLEVLKARALQNIPATGAQPAAQTGEALAGLPKVSPGEELDAGSSDQPIPAGKTTKAGQRPNGPYSGPRTPVMETADSGHLNKIGYDPASQTAVVEFENGKVYEYRGVPPEMYENMKNADSQGSYVAQNFKGRYETNYRGAVKPPTAAAKLKTALLNQAGSLGR